MLGVMNMDSKGVAMPAASTIDVADELRHAYGRFRSAFVRSCKIASVDPTSGTAIARGLGLTRQLSWHLASIAEEPEVSRGLTMLPGRRGLSLMIDALGASAPEAQAEIVEATGRLDDAITQHAGDRARLDLLTAAWGHDKLEEHSVALRREGLRVQTALLGLQTAVQVRGVIFAPTEGKTDQFALASYCYFDNLVRFRGDRPCRIFYADIPWNYDGSPAIDETEMTSHMEEMYRFAPQFSSVAHAPVEMVVQRSRGWVNLLPGPIGHGSALDLAFIGHSSREYQRYAEFPRHTFQIAQFSFVPTETYVTDLLMTRALAEEADLFASSEVMCFDAATGLPLLPATRQDPAFLYNFESRRHLTPDEFDIDPGRSTLTQLIAESARGLGVEIDELVGVRYTTKHLLAATISMISRRLPDGGSSEASA